MRIGLNLLHALPEIGGAWNYIAGLLAGMAECDTVNTYVAFVTRDSRVLVPASANFVTIDLAVHSQSRPQRIFYENTTLQVHACRHRVDLMHWFTNAQGLINTVPAAVTFYDLMVFARPEAFSALKRKYLQTMMNRTVRNCRMLLPISEATGADLAHVLGAKPEHITVIPPILSLKFKVTDSETTARLKARYSLPDKFWLYVAHFYPHKNHLRLLEAYHLLMANGGSPWPLVLCGDLKGSDEVILSAISKLHLEEAVTLISRLPGSELPALFSAAEAQVFPSLFEGAGIPILEAMACGCPLISSALPSAREFAGDAAEYFDANDSDSISRAMWEFQQDGHRRDLCRARGLVRAAKFRAEPVIRTLLDAYGKAVHPQEVR